MCGGIRLRIYRFVSCGLCRNFHDNGQVRMSMLRKSENAYEVNPSKSPEDLICTNPYIQISTPSLVRPADPSENTFTFASPQTLSDSQPDQVFDDPTYAVGYRPPPLSKNTTPRHQYQPPSAQTTPKKTSTLERAASAMKEKVSSLKRRTESSSNLLDGEDSGDYEDVVVDSKRAPPSVPLKPTPKHSRWAWLEGYITTASQPPINKALQQLPYLQLITIGVTKSE